MREVLACLLILALLPAIAFAGQPGFVLRKDEESELWRTRSQTLTDDLLKDAGQLSPMRRAVVLARLAQRKQSLHTAEDFLQAATGEKNEGVRTRLELHAATVAKESKDYDLAFRILDGMTKEERESMGEAWESFRWIGLPRPRLITTNAVVF